MEHVVLKGRRLRFGLQAAALLATAGLGGCGSGDDKQCRAQCSAFRSCGYLPSPLGSDDTECRRRCEISDMDVQRLVQSCNQTANPANPEGSAPQATNCALCGGGECQEARCSQLAVCLTEAAGAQQILGQAAVNVRLLLVPPPGGEGSTTSLADPCLGFALNHFEIRVRQQAANQDFVLRTTGVVRCEPNDFSALIGPDGRRRYRSRPFWLSGLSPGRVVADVILYTSKSTTLVVVSSDTALADGRQPACVELEGAGGGADDSVRPPGCTTGAWLKSSDGSENQLTVAVLNFHDGLVDGEKEGDASSCQ